MQQVLVIAGPTAVGKTALSLKLAQALNGEIISGDSMQVYRHLDIGTAKATPAEQQVVPHHLIDVKDVTEQFTVAEFVKQAQAAITAIAAHGHLPIVVGGTGFYLQALLDGLTLGGKDSTDLAVRKQWLTQARAHDSDWLWQQLNQRDPAAAKKIPATNYQRLARALEVITTTGKLFSQQEQRQPQFDSLVIALHCNRQLLYDRINQRVDQMVAAGVLREAKWLAAQGGLALPAGKAIGYKEFFPYFEGEITEQEAIALVKRNSRRYAKRQLTWLRNKMTVSWYNLVENPASYADLLAEVQAWRQKN